MQVNMCCGVLILFIVVVSSVQLQSTVPFSVSTSNAVNISTESNNNSKDHSTTHTITTATSNSTTSPTKTTYTTTTHAGAPKISTATSNSTTSPTKTTYTTTTHASAPKISTATSNSTTSPTKTTNTSTTHAIAPKTNTAIPTSTTSPTTTDKNSSPGTTKPTSKSTTNPTTIIENSTTGSAKSTTTVATHTSNPDVTTGTTHKIGLSTTVTATNPHSKDTIKPETSSRTQSPGRTKTTTLATSTVRVTDLGKIYISEVMVGRDVPNMVELFVTAGTNVSHYILAVFDDSQNMVQSYQLYQQQDGFLIVTLNNTMLGSETNSVGIALYDTNLWIKKTLNNTYGLVDALVIGTSFQNTSARLIQILTPGCLPIVLQLNTISGNKSITRCSDERACDLSMFIYTSSSFGKNNSANCEESSNHVDTITLKFNCSCQTCVNTSINEIIHFLIQEIDKICHCEVTAINIKDTYLACCGGTALHATIAAADSEQLNNIMTAYRTLLKSITTVTLGHNNYTISKECDSFCCHQTILPTESSKSSTESTKSSTESTKSSTESTKSSTESTNVKLKVAVTVTCITVFLVIIIIVVLYRRRKKRGVHQFSMIRLSEEDEDLIMDGVEDDKNVGGQEATFYKIRLGS